MSDQQHNERNKTIKPEAEVEFLTEEFEIPAIRAAALIADSEESAEELAAYEMRRQRAADPLAGKPVPSPQHADDHPAPAFESTKPLSVRNNRTGAG
jgi:hypothetical protein